MKKAQFAAGTLLLVLGAILLVLWGYTRVDKAPSQDLVSQRLLSWHASQETFEYQGHRVSYHDSGGESDEVLLLLHGYPTSSYDWVSVWSELSDGYRLIAIDMLGFGFSDKPNDILYSISLQTDIQEALLRDLGIREVHLLAHDYGDNIAQEFLARFHEQDQNAATIITSVVLLNGGLFPETHHPTTIQSLLRSPVGAIVSSLANMRLFRNNFVKVFGRDTQPTEQDLIDHWFLICQNDGHKINHRLTHAIDDRKANRDRWVGTMVSTQVPILFINGLQDPVTGKETVDRYLELVPRPNVVKLDSVGHYPHVENPRVVLDHVESFHSKLDGP